MVKETEETTKEEQQQDNNNIEDDDVPKDDEGLLLEYDVIICGTGLVQSILASALTRAGKSVLHCDGMGHYGELHASLNLPYLQQGSWDKDMQSLKDDTETTEESRNHDRVFLHPAGACHGVVVHSTRSKNSATPPALQVGMRVKTDYGNGVIQSLATEEETEGDSSSSTSLEVSLVDWKLANGSHPTVFFGPAGNSTPKSVVPTSWLETQEILQHKSRSFALDLSPRLLYCSGPAVTSLLTSGVADYLEFKSIEGLLWMSQEEEEKWTQSRVPCSKGDVFATKLLKPMDKRHLMKFLQLALDYAIAKQSAEYETTTNESTAEKKEKDEDSTQQQEDSSTEQVQSVNERQLNQGRSLARPQNKAVSTDDLQKLQQCIQQGMDFDSYLKEQQRLSPRLQSLVRHALALETTPSSTTLETGMTSLCQHVQALGRYGTTAFLVPLYGSGELPQSFCRSAAVHGGTYLLRRAAKQILLQQEGQSVRGIVLDGEDVQSSAQDKTILCNHVITSREAVASNSTTSEKRIVRRISVLRGKLVPGEQQRHVFLFPPRSVLDKNSHAIHGIALDDSVLVAPAGCTVLHLTTTVDEEAPVNETVLERAVDLLISSSLQKEQGSQRDLEEIYHVCFSFPMHSDDAAQKLPQGLHLCNQADQSLIMDGAFEQAKAVFVDICPIVDFLSLSEEMDSAVKERVGDRDDNDDEKAFLESAMNMMDISNKQEDDEDGTAEKP